MTHDTDGATQVVLADVATGGTIATAAFGPLSHRYRQSFGIVADLNHNQVSELGVVLEDTQNGAHQLQLRDARSGALLRELALEPVVAPKPEPRPAKGSGSIGPFAIAFLLCLALWSLRRRERAARGLELARDLAETAIGRLP